MNVTTSLTTNKLCCVRQQRCLFANLSFELQAGEALFVEGPNGSGKSSLLRLLAGIATPDSGDVLWGVQAIQENLHYVGHANGIKLGLTVSENLELMQRLAMDCRVALRAPRNDEVLALLQLHPQKNKLAKHLSAGQRRRLALARLFLLPKPVWILDEPMTALDVATQATFLAEMEKHLEQGGIVVASSHQPITIHRASKTLRLPLC